jgi:DNA-binding transcriptional LysR family regulator
MQRILTDWDDLRHFLAAARTGSFKAAGAVLGSDATTVGRRIQRLEERLAAKLFDRHGQGMRLTPAGRELERRAAAMEDAALEVERHLAGTDQTLSGMVTLAAPDGIAAYWLPRHLAGFLGTYPELTIEVMTGVGLVDLSLREADIAIQVIPPRQPRLVAWRAGRLRFALFATREYLDRHGTPQSSADLARHTLVEHAGYLGQPAMQAWTDITRVGRVAYLAHSTAAFLSAVRAGIGLAPFPLYHRHTAPDLIQLPPSLDLALDVWLVSHEETNRSRKVRTLLAQLRDWFDRDRAEWFA